jgi:dTDP-4-dehydrorhamnose reductase
VAQALLERGTARGHEIVPLCRPDLDLAGNWDAIQSAFLAIEPDAVVSAAAYTAVDKAESERDKAFAINEGGASAIAHFARKARVPLVHLSTDYVFDGTKVDPYTEDDATGPTTVYGQSKLAAELAVLGSHDNVAILRTAWIHSPFGTNFVKTMLRAASECDEVNVVADQFGNPTNAFDIAEGILAVIQNLNASSDPALRGIFHMAGADEASWADLAEGVFAVSVQVGGPAARVRRIMSSDYPAAARRPSNSRLACRKLATVHGVTLPGWHVSVAEVVGRLIGARD